MKSWVVGALWGSLLSMLGVCFGEGPQTTPGKTTTHQSSDISISYVCSPQQSVWGSGNSIKFSTKWPSFFEKFGSWDEIFIKSRKEYFGQSIAVFFVDSFLRQNKSAWIFPPPWLNSTSSEGVERWHSPSPWQRGCLPSSRLWLCGDQPHGEREVWNRQIICV